MAPSIVGLIRLPRVVRRASDQTEAEIRAVRREIDQAADQLANLWEADSSSTRVHLPELRRYLRGLTEDSIRAAVRPVQAVLLPRTREFPSWTPRPPRRPAAVAGEAEPPSLDD